MSNDVLKEACGDMPTRIRIPIPVEDEYPEELGGGMVKRVAIARA